MIAAARWILRSMLPPDVREAILADLDGEYTRVILPSRGRLRAAEWYWRQTAGSIGPALDMRRRRRLARGGRTGRATLARLIPEAAQDLRFAVRLLGRQRAFAAAVVATLALGIGANTAIFSVVDGVLLRSLPYRDPSRLVRVWSANPRGIARNSVSPPDYFDWRDEARGFDALAAFGSSDVTLTGAGDPVRLGGAEVTANLAGTLGVTPMAGRWLLPEDTRGDGLPVLVIGERLWRERFGAAQDIIGRALSIDGRTVSVIGVMPDSFRFPTIDVRLWMPLADSLRAGSRSAHVLGVVGRLSAGTRIEAGADALRTVAKRLETQYPDNNRGWSVTVTSLRDSIVGDVRTPLLVLLAAVASVLLIACANVTGLMLARAVARSRELAVRAAIGASSGRLLRQQIVESSVLALMGGAAGLPLAAWTLIALRSMTGVTLPFLDRVTLDTRVLAVAAVTSLVCGILTGILPAWTARMRSAAALREATRATSQGVRVRQAIVLIQVAAATALVVASALLLRSFDRLTRVDVGFNAGHALLADVSLPATRYARAARAPFFARALDEVGAVPGVEAAGAGGPLPLSGQDGLLRFGVQIEGRVPAPNLPDRTYLRWATPGYFTAMGIELRAGRLFEESDTASAGAVAVVDELLARRYFGDASPVGRHLAMSNEQGRRREIIGVVAAVRQTALDRDAEPHVYVPEAQMPSPTLTFVIRAAGDARAVAAGVRDVVRAIDPELPISNARLLSDVVTGSTAARRFSAMILSVFAAMAVALTLVGVSGVVSQTVAQSTREIGVRIALGASGADVVSLVVRRALRTATAGVATGSAVAWLAAPALGGMLYGIAPRDPSTIAIAAALVVIAATLAAYVPARRILRLDVISALRVD
jgi:putative ABC transport system permease protein